MNFTKIDVPEINIRNNIDPIDLSEIERKLYDNALNNVISSLKELEPDAPEEAYSAFAKVFFKFEISSDYDLINRTYSFVCTPVWKSPSDVDKDSKEYEIIRKYGMEGMKQ